MIIVTGGAGFIGSNIVKALNDRGRKDILIVDNLGKTEKYKNLIGLKFMDYVQREDFLRFVADDELDAGEIEVIFHDGACSDTMEYDVNYMMKLNYEYSKELFHYCADNEIEFIYASSASTYGDGENGFREIETCESALNPYAFSKLLFDRYVRQNLYEVESKVIGLRYFNVFGPQEFHKGRMASIALQMYNQIKKSGVIKLFKGTDGYLDGEQRRDFIYVKDVAKVNLWCFENEIASGVYNCGTGNATTFNAVAQAVISALGKGEIEYIDFPKELEGKYQSFTQADTRKILSAGYDGGFTDINDAVQEYCKFLNEGGYY
ncbi:MAG: ADP-glyceromanno-heptose 6-epimerase [Selenomonadaceae bacterium]|nr:ADP-glyceromanno-heptose 6-epimerase [Selenomonadaceae bacterium]